MVLEGLMKRGGIYFPSDDVVKEINQDKAMVYL